MDSNATIPHVAATGARMRSQRRATAEETTLPPPDATGMAVAEIGIQKYIAPPVFIPLPILGDTAFKCISDYPLNLIEGIKSAATNSNEAHKDSDPNVNDAKKGAKLFEEWLYTVHKDLIEEMRLSSIKPNNVKLLAYAED
jgi:hypothetical protein